MFQRLQVDGQLLWNAARELVHRIFGQELRVGDARRPPDGGEQIVGQSKMIHLLAGDAMQYALDTIGIVPNGPLSAEVRWDRAELKPHGKLQRRL